MMGQTILAACTYGDVILHLRKPTHISVSFFVLTESSSMSYVAIGKRVAIGENSAAEED